MRGSARGLVGIATWMWCFASGGSLAAAEDQETELLRRGTESFLRQDYEGARVALGQAYELKPKAATLLKLGLAELQSDHPVEAATHLREYLAHDEEPEEKLVPVRTKWLPRAEARTARLDVFAPAGAEVRVDGAAEGRAPTPSIIIRYGEHEVSAQQGPIVEARHVVAKGGELVEVHFQRVTDAPSGAPVIGCVGGACKEDKGEQVDAATSRAKWITVIALGSGAVIAAGMGVGFGIASRSKAGAAQSLLDQPASGGAGSECFAVSSPPCVQFNDDVRAYKQYVGMSVAAYVGAGVLGVASFATWMLWHSERPKRRVVQVHPTLSARGAGLVLGGEW